MPYFKCKLVNLKNGMVLTKEEYADDKFDLYDKLSKNFTIVSVKQLKNAKKIKLKNSDILFFFSYLLELTKIGVNIQEGLMIMIHEIKTKNIKQFCKIIYENIKSGTMLSESIKKSCTGVNDFYISIISMGEVSNNLEQSFNYIVNYINVSNLIRSKTRKAMIYPIFLIILMGAMITAASTFMIPKMMDFGASMGITPSYSTVLLKNFADFVSKNWYSVAGSIFSFVSTISLIAKFSLKAKTKWDWIKLKIPIVSSIIVKSNIAKFCIFFSVSYKSGVNIVEALNKAKDVISNEIIKADIAKIANKVEYGSTVSEAMEYTLIPSFAVRMFKIGEATGEIANSLDNVVKFYTREIDNLSENLISSIKPAGIFLAGGLIIWIISATILPIYTQFIGKMMQ